MDIKVKKKLLIAMLFSTAFMIFLLMRVDWQHFSLIAGRLDFKYLTIAFSVFIFGNLVRAARFSKLDHTGKKLVHWWNINAFYNFITATLPGGMGEAATAYIIRKFSQFNLLGAIRILFLVRLMDLFAISSLFFFAALQITSRTSYRGAAISISVTLFLISFLGLIPAVERFVIKILRRLPGHIKLIQKVCEKLDELLEIINERRAPGSFVIILAQSMLSMIGGIAVLHLILRACGVEYTLVQSVYCYGIYALFQIVPIQGVAGIGTQAAWWALALNAAGYASADSIALGIVLHGMFYIFIIMLGLSALVVLRISRTRRI